MASPVDPPSSPRSVRPARNLSASWSHIAAVAAAPSPPTIPSRDSSERSSQKSPSDSQSPPPSESSDHVIEGNGAAASRGKKTVWNVPSNGASEGGAVMDAACWPALSESARASPKSSSSDSLKGLSDGSTSVNMGPVSPTAKPASSAPNPSLTSSPSSSARNKTMKHAAANAVSDLPNGGLATPSPLPALSQTSQPVPDRQQPSPKGLANKNSSNSNHNWDNSSRAVGVSHQSHGGNDHHRGYGGGGRRGNNGQHNNYGYRRDPERGGYEWNHRSFVRDVHMQQLHPQWGVRPYSRPPPVAAQLIAPPPPPRPFSPNMGFPDMSSAIYYVPAPPHPESLRGLPFVPHPTPVPAPPVMIFPAPDPQRAVLLKQIDYYFSPENLCKDTYLRNYMDEQGWVHISVIAGFNRVKQLTNNIQYIIDTLRLSSIVEVQGDKIRRRNDWSIWVFNTANHFGSTSGSQSPITTNYDSMTAQFHNVGLDSSSNHSSMRGSADTVLAGPTTGDFNSQQSVDGQQH